MSADAVARLSRTPGQDRAVRGACQDRSGIPIGVGAESGNGPERGVHMPVQGLATWANVRSPTGGAVVRPVPPLPRGRAISLLRPAPVRSGMHRNILD